MLIAHAFVVPINNSVTQDQSSFVYLIQETNMVPSDFLSQRQSQTKRITYHLATRSSIHTLIFFLCSHVKLTCNGMKP